MCGCVGCSEQEALGTRRKHPCFSDTDEPKENRGREEPGEHAKRGLRTYIHRHMNTEGERERERKGASGAEKRG